MFEKKIPYHIQVKKRFLILLVYSNSKKNRSALNFYLLEKMRKNQVEDRIIEQKTGFFKQKSCFKSISSLIF